MKAVVAVVSGKVAAGKRTYGFYSCKMHEHVLHPTARTKGWRVSSESDAKREVVKVESSRSTSTSTV